MITEKNVQQLCEEGSFQLGPEYQPPSFDRLFGAFYRYGRPHIRTSIKRVESVHPRIREIYQAVLSLACYEIPKRPYVRVTTTDDVDTRIGVLWHQDFKPRIPTGFSALFAKSILGVQNNLLTAGRGDAPDMGRLRQYDYSAGPILMAQEGFMLPGMENIETGGTWHTGWREDQAEFMAIDFLRPSRPSYEVPTEGYRIL